MAIHHKLWTWSVLGSKWLFRVDGCVYRVQRGVQITAAVLAAATLSAAVAAAAFTLTAAALAAAAFTLATAVPAANLLYRRLRPLHRRS